MDDTPEGAGLEGRENLVVGVDDVEDHGKIEGDCEVQLAMEALQIAGAAVPAVEAAFADGDDSAAFERGGQLVQGVVGMQKCGVKAGRPVKCHGGVFGEGFGEASQVDAGNDDMRDPDRRRSCGDGWEIRGESGVVEVAVGVEVAQVGLRWPLSG